MMEKMEFKLQTKSPVVVSGPGNNALLTTTRDVFSGTTLRGIAAARYMEQKGLGADAHENPDFRRLFFGSVRFVDAYPAQDGEAAITLPASLQKSKIGGDVLDLFDDDPLPGYKALRGLGVVTKGNRIFMAEVKKSMTLHMSRSGELPLTGSGGDNTERLSGKSEEGHIFNYESLDEGQVFIGLLIGEKQNLEELRTVLGETWQGRAGRSKYVEYGEIKCTLGESKPLPSFASLPTGSEVRLRLQTPLLPISGSASNANTVLTETVAKEMNKRRGTENAFSVGKIFANAETADNFVGIWRLRRPRQTTLSAGSCFALKKESGAWDAEDMEALRTLMHEGVGLRTEEGFGQLRFWPQEKRQMGEDSGRKSEKEPNARNITSVEVKKKAEAIVKAKRLESFRRFAAADVKKSVSSIAAHPAHVFVRLDSLLTETNQNENAASFAARVKAKLGEKKTAFSKHLDDIKITLPDGTKETLGDLLTENPTLPLEKDGRLGKADDRMAAFYRDIGMEDRLHAEDGDVFREYWHWFFRHARKAKAPNRKEAAE